MPDSFFKGRLRSLRTALSGLFNLFRTEPNMQVHLVAALLVTALGFYFQINATEWALQCLAIGLVMGLEAINTAVEELANKVESRKDDQIKKVKDFAAAGVVFAAFVSVLIGLFIYGPRLFSLF
jgi:diacylglycerol kinase (ATP)